MSLDPLPAPTAPRLRRPTWRDPRLVVGVVIVALSVTLGSWAVSSAGRTVPVYAAAGTLTPGEQVGPDRLRTVDVRLGPSTDRYLRADEPLPDELVVQRVVDDGELVARTALGPADAVDARSVAVPVGSGISDRLRKGAVVDLWFVPEAAPGSDAAPGEPEALVTGVVVEQVDVADAGLVVATGGTLHVLVPTAELPAVLAALSAPGSVAVVPVAGT
ncbi:hypothetical protein [Isoptericola variabilis]|uniref:SAF domain protein n=1 Tax=Isoptericola variabilis (strain 225) TaxID=743718 RepID=F6FRK4_ISOV2|nr:hypothetical protein [Isoptericola variabilis]AEG45062.1 hypothetical protein Isova_2345 [Isoptericola variabilis 225]TWH26189.1 hypothetical protein L600_000700000680 [Isoptericola variabilis J7]